MGSTSSSPLGLPPIPDNLDDYLTNDQKTVLARLEKTGWSLAFIRRQKVEKPVVVLLAPSNYDYAVLKEDGELEYPAKIKLRYEDQMRKLGA